MGRAWWVVALLALALVGCSRYGIYDNLAWSPDGKALAYHFGNELFIGDAAGGDGRRVEAEGVADHPAWLPDGRLAYVVGRQEKGAGNETDLNESLWIYDPGTGKSQHVAGELNPVHGLAWHPRDASRALVQMNTGQDRRPGSVRLYLLQSGSGTLTEVAGIPESQVERAGWLADGSGVAYVQNGVLFTQRLGDSAIAACPCQGEVSKFALSPDGRWIVYRSHVRGQTRGWVYIVPADFRGESAKLTEIDMAAFGFSPDGLRLAYTKAGGSGQNGIHFFDMPAAYR